MALLKSHTDFQKYVKINSGTELYDSLKPYIEDAQSRYLSRHVGSVLIGKIDAWYNSATPSTNADYTALLPYLQNPLAKFAIYLAVPYLDVQISNAGLTVTNNSNLAPASKERAASLRAESLAQAWDMTEVLLKYLETNKAKYSDWTASEAFTEATGCFIRTAEQFDTIIPIGASRIRFQEIKPLMKDIELMEIDPVLSTALANKIRTGITDNNLNNANKLILPYIRRAVAHFAWYHRGEADKHRMMAENYVAEIRKIINAYPDNYPEFKASTAYVAGSTLDRYANDTDNPTFIFGGGQ